MAQEGLEVLIGPAISVPCRSFRHVSEERGNVLRGDLGNTSRVSLNARGYLLWRLGIKSAVSWLLSSRVTGAMPVDVITVAALPKLPAWITSMTMSAWYVVLSCPELGPIFRSGGSLLHRSRSEEMVVSLSELVVS